MLVRRFFEIWKEEGFLPALHVFLRKVKFVIKDKLKIWLAPPDFFKTGYLVEDNSEIVLYLNNPDHLLHKINYQPVRSVHPTELTHRTVKVSLIATVWNEGQNVEEWMRSIFKQTRLPDEIVITDAGSTDETVGLLHKFASESPVPIQIITEPGANIAKGRNIAISNAHYDLIATTDFGCRLHTDWLEKIITPFELDKETQVVAGMYQGVDENGNVVDRSAWWSIKSIKNPRTFLPSGRSSAFTKDIWKTIGGYPEWLSISGEDTYYALELKKFATKWAFVPEAIAEWQAPKTMLDYWKKLHYWSMGDGESGVYASTYWKLTLQVLFPIILSITFFLFITSILVFDWIPCEDLALGFSVGLWIILLILIGLHLKVPLSRSPHEVGALVARILGFIKGARNRGNIEQARVALLQGTIFILSGVPINDTGGGARCTQITLELLRKSYAVVFINKFPKYESVDLDLSISDANLLTYHISEFDWDKFAATHSTLINHKFIGALVEMPLPEFLPIIQVLRQYGGVVAYDLIDEWNTTLGGKWYTEDAELAIIMESQVLFATAPLLADRLSQISQRSVCLLPNAVNSRLFNPDRFYAKPADFPEAKWTAIYIGALWGEWFDWKLLSKIAKKYPEAAIVAIGDYHGECPDQPPNLHFLGLKLQSTLPNYLAYADVAIIPWKVNSITQATSPLKIYEYLAMRKPVIAPAINPLRNIQGVFLANNEQDFLAMVGTLKDVALPIEEINQFIQNNNWNARINCLLELMRAVPPINPPQF